MTNSVAKGSWILGLDYTVWSAIINTRFLFVTKVIL